MDSIRRYNISFGRKHLTLGIYSGRVVHHCLSCGACGAVKRMIIGRIGRGMALLAGLVMAACVPADRPDVALAPPPQHARPQYAPAQYPPPYRPQSSAPAPSPQYRPAPTGLASAIDLMGRMFQGRVGIAVESVDEGWIVQSNGDTRLPQQSVSKLWVALTVLDYRDSGRLRLDDPVTVSRQDLTLFHQPIAALAAREGGYETTVGDLLTRAMTMSDNTANDRLLQVVGGPTAVRDMIRRKGLGNIRFGPGERLLQAGTAGLTWRPEYSVGNAFTLARSKLSSETRLSAYERYLADPPDGAAPAAIAGALTKLKLGQVLSPASTQWLLSTMESSKTGKQRLRGAVPYGWTFGHKTGTGQDLSGRTAGYNDVGLLTAPDGRSWAVAVMIGDTVRPVSERQELMQSVIHAIVSTHGGWGQSTGQFGR